MELIISPCPNDTFIFHAWIKRILQNAPPVRTEYADIEITNKIVQNPKSVIAKISCGALHMMSAEYRMLPCGGAVGYNCGPLVLGRDQLDQDLSGKRVGVPSLLSSAYVLFQLWSQKNRFMDIDVQVMPFNRIMPAICEGEIDAGLVIHEARFVYHNYELKMLIDLGQFWQKETWLPVPLGAIVAHNSLNIDLIIDSIRKSVRYAWENPTASSKFITYHAQELDPKVVHDHIRLYVNNFSYELGDRGMKSIKLLVQHAKLATYLDDAKAPEPT